ncbi:polyphosphate polymerase domain-containing protein [Demequina aurantiaca]|uniref:polyphosphate polymerase domain-containing protein n=1 Tax=Demequina aurantiaca TaxID=676200 RepID=UPI000784D8BC|nr:polyphosphate polymerase domain-containing protein [Demequina aurantiaca]
MTALVTRSAWAATVADLDPISLESLNEQAALQTRVDRKYIVPADQWATVFASLGQGFRVLEVDGRRGFGYESDYFDTADLAAYHDAARRRPRRYKVRTRHYLDSGLSAIEVKLRSARGETVKHREWLPQEAARSVNLTFESRVFVGSFDQIGHDVDLLTRVLTTSYERTTLTGDDARITVDSSVSATAAGGAQTGFGSALIVETKSASRAGSVDRALWAHGIRPARVSKYCTSLAALRPELPSNRWARTLRRHIVDAPATPAAF